ncbi:MAG TPA: hypothetical protein VL307_04605 [Chitinophagaceae bacterium]|nr:hypothetical protein [Chitinophagaceae bacterium]
MHRKTVCWLLLLLCSIGCCFGQEKTSPTNSFMVTGKVKTALRFSLEQAAAYKTVKLDSLVIYNHLMQKKRVLKDIKGILLKDIIEKAGIDIASPKLLSEIFITCVASDNYKVVFSWNELFNTPLGKQVLIVTALDGKPAAEGNDRIAVLSAMDEATGRRFVKGLEKIIIEQVK